MSSPKQLLQIERQLAKITATPLQFGGKEKSGKPLTKSQLKARVINKMARKSRKVNRKISKAT